MNTDFEVDLLIIISTVLWTSYAPSDNASNRVNYANYIPVAACRRLTLPRSLLSNRVSFSVVLNHIVHNAFVATVSHRRTTWRLCRTPSMRGATSHSAS